MRETGFTPEGEVREVGSSIIQREKSFMDRLRGRARILGFALISLTEACATVSATGGMEVESISTAVETEQENERNRTRRILSQEEAPHEGDYDIVIESEEVLRAMEEQSLRVGIRRLGPISGSEGLLNQSGEPEGVFYRYVEDDLPPRKVTLATENVGGESILIITIEERSGRGRETVMKFRGGAIDSVTVY